jgi:hypothetical protein
MSVGRPSRRTLLALAGLALVGGCPSDADRTNTTFFDAVRRDALSRWRPEWATKVSDSETPIGGPYPDSGPRLRHSTFAVTLPPSAVADAIAEALATGWQARGGSEGFLKPIADTELKLWLMISSNPEFQSVDMQFVAMRI